MNETATTRTYVHEASGFAFKYFKDWSLHELDDGSVLLRANQPESGLPVTVRIEFQSYPNDMSESERLRHLIRTFSGTRQTFQLMMRSMGKSWSEVTWEEIAYRSVPNGTPLLIHEYVLRTAEQQFIIISTSCAEASATQCQPRFADIIDSFSDRAGKGIR